MEEVGYLWKSSMHSLNGNQQRKNALLQWRNSQTNSINLCCHWRCNFQRVAVPPDLRRAAQQWVTVLSESKLYPCGGQSHTICTRLAASRRQFRRFYSCCMRLAATRVQFACAGGHLGTICMRMAAIRKHFLHALEASCVQSRQFFESTLRDSSFN
jgi:hypothetical protein